MNAAPVTIRRARVADVARLVELNAYVHQPHVDAHPDIFRPTADRPGIEEFFTSLLADRAQHALVADLDSRPVGYLLAEVQRRPAHTFSHRHDRLYVHQVSVEPDLRRRGIGRALFAELERIARSESLGEVALDTWSFNEDARRFFSAIGYSVYNVRMWKRNLLPAADGASVSVHRDA